MTDACAPHRPRLAALADGELGLVPEATREHVTGCDACAAEVADHGLLGERLRDALLHPGEPAPHATAGWWGTRRSITVLAAAAALLVAALGAGTTGLISHSGADPVVLAVSAAQGAPVLRSADPAAIRAWCSGQSDRPGPPVAIPNLTPVGARMDTADGATVVTIFYRSATDELIAVGWLDATTTPPSRSRVEERSVSGEPILVLLTPVGEAVLSGGDSVNALWDGAARLQALTGSRP
ncbi:MAG: anti-sigma factor [Candidatus Dormibacteria bacterium]